MPGAGGRSFPVSPGISAMTTSTVAATRVRSTVAAIEQPRVGVGGAGRGDGDLSRSHFAWASVRECHPSDLTGSRAHL